MAHIYPRKNKDGKITSYTIRVFRGKDENGRNLKPYTTSFKPQKGWSALKTERELKKFATLYENECKMGCVVDNRQTFAKYADYVINIKSKNENMKHNTLHLYKILLKRINVAIGHIKLGDIRPQHLNSFYEMLAQDGVNFFTNGGLSSKTIHAYHSLINLILRQAVKELLIPYNPADRATPPACQKREAKFLEIEDIKNILFYLSEEPLRWRVAMSLLIYTGCRRGEVLGIKVENIDFENCTICIKNNLLYTPEKGIYQDTPKTKKSARVISIPEDVINLIRRLVVENKKNALKLGTKWVNTGYLLTGATGLPYNPMKMNIYCSYFEKKYNEIIDKKNEGLKDCDKLKRLPHINPHAFRHSQASILINMGMDIATVSSRLGHANITTTANIYSHVLMKADKVASDKLDNLFNAKNVKIAN